MPLSIEHLKQAEADELEIWLRIASDNVTAADRLLDRFDEAVDMLARHPEAGRSHEELAEGLRGYPVSSYMIFYRHDAKALRVVRILSTYRELGPEFFD
jgi:toxin ParE1/3/4